MCFRVVYDAPNDIQKFNSVFWFIGRIGPISYFLFSLESWPTLARQQRVQLLFTLLYVATPSKDIIFILFTLKQLHIKLSVWLIVLLRVFGREIQIRNFLFSYFLSGVDNRVVLLLNVVDEYFDEVLIFCGVRQDPLFEDRFFELVDYAFEN